MPNAELHIFFWRRFLVTVFVQKVDIYYKFFRFYIYEKFFGQQNIKTAGD